jgi:hypothetical protein
VIKAGYQYEWTKYESIGNQNVSGQAGFSTGYTNLPNTANTGLGFASFLLGDASSSTVTTPRFFLLRYNYDAFFVQDDWRISPKLTLNIGLRHDSIRPRRFRRRARISRDDADPVQTAVWAPYCSMEMAPLNTTLAVRASRLTWTGSRFDLPESRKVCDPASASAMRHSRSPAGRRISMDSLSSARPPAAVIRAASSHPPFS